MTKNPDEPNVWKDNLRDLITGQADIVNILLFSLRGIQGERVEKEGRLRDQKEAIDVIIMMIQAIGVSCHSVVKLSPSKEMSVRDCYPIARSVVETAVNVAFILAGGEEVARLAQKHALQKYYRNLRRRSEIGGWHHEVSHKSEVGIDELPGLGDAIELFTDKRGKEIRDWTPESIDRKIEIIGNKYGKNVALNFGAARVEIYRNSSEILHGTYYGTNYFWQPTLFSKKATLFSRSDADQYSMNEMMFNHFLSVFNALFFCINALFSVFDKEFGIPLIREAQDRLNDRLKEVPPIAEALEKDTGLVTIKAAKK